MIKSSEKLLKMKFNPLEWNPRERKNNEKLELCNSTRKPFLKTRARLISYIKTVFQNPSSEDMSSVRDIIYDFALLVSERPCYIPRRSRFQSVSLRLHKSILRKRHGDHTAGRTATKRWHTSTSVESSHSSFQVYRATIAFFV